ncbi:MAG: Holliday junction branch migration protein RuvA [Gammaproteobacteria bacterium]|nr:Holliday junction branch migration protein RuvA [Gammaproteobacteria bacterium]
MIGRIQGRLLSKQPPGLLVDVHGVGYEMEAPMSTFYQLPAPGEEVVLHTHMVVREDAQLLYAFYSIGERSLFRSLIRINGVGPKLGLTILSGISAEAFARAVQEGDAAALTGLPGVGKKTAERLIVELRDKLGDDIAPLPADAAGTTASVGGHQPSPVSDAVSALTALGYKAQDASRMVRAVDAAGLETEAIIRAALQGVAKA